VGLAILLLAPLLLISSSTYYPLQFIPSYSSPAPSSFLLTLRIFMAPHSLVEAPKASLTFSVYPTFVVSSQAFPDFAQNMPHTLQVRSR
jgi:hypothetical protein